jgi:hypothetical protein
MVPAETVVHRLVRTIRRAPLMVQDTSTIIKVKNSLPLGETIILVD